MLPPHDQSGDRRRLDPNAELGSGVVGGAPKKVHTIAIRPDMHGDGGHAVACRGRAACGRRLRPCRLHRSPRPLQNSRWRRRRVRPRPRRRRPRQLRRRTA